MEINILYFGYPMKNFSWLQKGSLSFQQALIHTVKHQMFEKVFITIPLHI